MNRAPALAGLILGWGAVILGIVLIVVGLAIAAGTHGTMAIRAIRLLGRGRPEPLLDENGRPPPGGISEKARLHQQPELAQNVAPKPVQQGGQERPVARPEPRPGLTKLPLRDHDLVAQRQDLDALVPVPRRKKPQQREHVRHAQLGYS